MNPEYSKKIEDEKLQFLFKNVEIPLSKVLFDMENQGFFQTFALDFLLRTPEIIRNPSN